MRLRFFLVLGGWLLAAFAASAQGVQLPTDESFHARIADLPACNDDPDRVHVRLGSAGASPARSEAIAFMPHELNVTGHVDRPGEMTMNLRPRSGCPDQPIDTLILLLAPDVAFPDGLSLAAGETGPNRQMARMRDSGRCPRVADAFACAGTFPGPDGPTPVTAVIAADPDATGRGGLPLFMICESEKPDGYICEASGYRNGVTFEAAMRLDVIPDVALMRDVEMAADKALARISFDADSANALPR